MSFTSILLVLIIPGVLSVAVGALAKRAKMRRADCRFWRKASFIAFSLIGIFSVANLESGWRGKNESEGKKPIRSSTLPPSLKAKIAERKKANAQNVQSTPQQLPVPGNDLLGTWASKEKPNSIGPPIAISFNKDGTGSIEVGAYEFSQRVRSHPFQWEFGDEKVTLDLPNYSQLILRTRFFGSELQFSVVKSRSIKPLSFTNYIDGIYMFARVGSAQTDEPANPQP